MVQLARISSCSKQGHDLELPPGFRFHPTDEELIMQYLQKQVSFSLSPSSSAPCPELSIIPQVDIYKFDPWHLPDKAGVGENEWYFFTPRDRKYPNGARPNRAAVSGYWKATGTDKAIYSGSKYVGVKKALVFYEGKPPKGIKTDWIMHEYRLSDPGAQRYKHNGSMRLDDWVLCRIYKKKTSLGRSLTAFSCDEDHQQTLNHQDCFPTSPYAANTNYDQLLFPRTYNSLTHDGLCRDNHQFGCSFSPHFINQDNNVHPSVAIKNEGFLEAGDRFRQHMQQQQQEQQFQGQNMDDHQTMFLNNPEFELQ